MTHDKSALLSYVKTLKQEILRQFESIEERIIALDDHQPQPVQVQAASDKWLDAEQLAEHFGVCKATIYQWGREGKIPSGVPFGPRQTRWKAAEVEALLIPKDDGKSLNIVTVKVSKKRRGRPSKVRRKEEFFSV